MLIICDEIGKRTNKNRMETLGVKISERAH